MFTLKLIVNVAHLLCVFLMAYCKIAFKSKYGVLEVSDFEKEQIIQFGKVNKYIPREVFHKAELNDWLKCFKQMSQLEQEEKQKAQVIKNLGEYISPLEKLGCFVVINNFQGIDFQGLDHPLVLRYPRPVALPSSDADGIFEIERFWVPHFLYPTNGTRRTKPIIKRNCQISKFLATFWETEESLEHINDYCLRIVHHLFASVSKPWRCEAQFALFPLMKLYDPKCFPLYYPRTFNYEGKPGWRTDEMLSLTVPIVSVVITNKEATYGLETLQELMVSTHIRTIQDSLSGPYIYQSVFLHGVVSRPILNMTTREKENTLIYLRLVRVSYENYLQHLPNQNAVLIKYSEELLSPGKLWKILSQTSSPSPDEMTVWLAYHGLACYKESFSFKYQRSAAEIISELKKRAWISMLGNHTLLQRGTKDELSCMNGVPGRPSPRDNSFKYSPMYLQWYLDVALSNPTQPTVQKYVETHKSLRFISCYTIKLEPLLFSELINVYHEWVWVCLICIIICLALLTSRIARKSSFVKSILGMFKVVVGQGDPFMHNAFSSTPLRLVAVTFLFMGIIISEGYKNSNMYNMISPRKIISREKMSDLVDEKFTMYSRLSKIKFGTDYFAFANPETVEFNVRQHWIEAIGLVFGHSIVLSYDEASPILGTCSLHPSVATFSRQLAIQHKDWFTYEIFKAFFLTEVKLGNVSMDPEQVFQLLETRSNNYDNFSHSQLLILSEIVGRWEVDDEERYSIQRMLSAILEQIVLKWEEETLFNFLQNCSNSALFLPEYETTSYAKRLKLKDNQTFSIGQESFPPTTSRVSLKGFIPPVLIKRIKWTETSGIWEWHATIVPHAYTGPSRTNMPVRATMSGHVIVIFLTLPVGFLLAISTVLGELFFYRVTHGTTKSVIIRRNKTSISVLGSMGIMLYELTNLLMDLTDKSRAVVWTDLGTALPEWNA